MTEPEPMEQVQVEPDAGYAANRDNWGWSGPCAPGQRRLLRRRAGRRSAAVVLDARRDAGLWRPHLPPGQPFIGLEGLSLVHLRCHIGTDTLSLARLGARCTGVDLSPVSLSIARDLADRAGEPIRYVEANALEAAAAVGEEVDLVYTSTGTICWVRDLATRSQQVAALLRLGGTFFFRDSPSANALSDDDHRVFARPDTATSRCCPARC